jgi:hypothetical protein
MGRLVLINRGFEETVINLFGGLYVACIGGGYKVSVN